MQSSVVEPEDIFGVPEPPCLMKFIQCDPAHRDEYFIVMMTKMTKICDGREFDGIVVFATKRYIHTHPVGLCMNWYFNQFQHFKGRVVLEG